MTPQEKVRRTAQNFPIFEGRAAPDTMRRVIETCAAMHIPRKIIANELGMSPGTVRSIICRSKQ